MIYGQDIKKEIIRFTAEEKDSVKNFNCGNEVINSYLKEEACDDPQTVTFIVKDKNNNMVICYYSLSCSGLVLDHGTGNKITIYPAVEIKMFAIDENYQHMPYSNDVEEGNPLKGYLKYQENIATKGTEGSDAYVIGAGNQAVWVYLTFIAKANETYYIFNKNTQIGFSGFEFTPGETSLGINSISNSVEKSVKGYYTLDGAKVNAPVNGITIVKYSDGTAKKVIK